METCDKCNQLKNKGEDCPNCKIIITERFEKKVEDLKQRLKNRLN